MKGRFNASSLPDYNSEYLHHHFSTSPSTSADKLDSRNFTLSGDSKDDYNEKNTLSRLQSLKVNFNQKKKEPFIIGVAGGSASGKTTVCSEIEQSLSNKRVCVISQDSFYRSLEEEEKVLAQNQSYDFDHPGRFYHAFDYDVFESTLRKLKEGDDVEIPVYCFKTHSRLTTTEKIAGADVIIVEGILIFFTKHIRDLMDMKIFVDTDSDVRLARRIRRDIQERGRDLDGVLTQYEKFVKNSFDDYIMPTKKYADMIIPRGGANKVAIDLLVEHIKSKLISINRNANY
ncbi:uridine kinase [Acrasis kona]|uniref:Uridine kinase n=1 Tax=Acrasis kona TaxID=1008807 RepID=A0AAW2ZMP0_9EUKA